MKKMIVAGVLLLAQLAPAQSAVHVVVGAEANGGNADVFLSRIEWFRKTRTVVALPKECKSSCTLYTILINDGLLCAQRDTQLVFHQFTWQSPRSYGTDGKPNSWWLDPATPEQLRRTWGAYPQRIRAAFPKGLPEPGYEVTIPASRFRIPVCADRGILVG